MKNQHQRVPPCSRKRKDLRDERTSIVLLDPDLLPLTILRGADLGAHQERRDRDRYRVVRHIPPGAHAAPEAERDVLRVEHIGIEDAVLEEAVRDEGVRVGVDLAVTQDRPEPRWC